MRKLALAVLLLGTSQWCVAGLFTDDEAHKKIGVLLQQVQALEARIGSTDAHLGTQETRQGAQETRLGGFEQWVGALESRLIALENRLGALENRFGTLENRFGEVAYTVQTHTKGLLDLNAQFDTLKAELNKLQGQNEVYAHDIDTTQKRQRDLYADLDGRLRRLERSEAQAKATAEKAPPAPNEAAAPPPAQSPSSAAAPTDETKIYETALNQFKSGNYSGAIASFQAFVGSYPSSALTPSALYWIGNSYFSLRDYKNAIATQQKLIDQFPTSSKLPDAMLNLASCQLGLEDTVSARKTLEDIVAKYPISNSATLAKKRLSNLK